MNRAAFFKALRARNSGVFGTSLTQKQVKGCEALLDACIFYSAGLAQAAYAIATGYGDTGGKMQPRRENMDYSAARFIQVWPSRFKTKSQAAKYAGRPRELANYVYGSRLGNRPGTDDGWNLRGAGMGQITGRDNATKWAKGLGMTPEEVFTRLCIDLQFSAHALVRPMLEGWATGHALERYVAGDKREYLSARKVWGGVEAEKYVTYARAFEAALIAAAYGATPESVALPAADQDAPPAPLLIEVEPARAPSWIAAANRLIWEAILRIKGDQK